MQQRFTGLIAAPFTALHGDGSLNLGVIEAQAEALVADGVRGAFVCGTTGEGMSLTVPERRAVADRWRAVAGDSLPLIVHVGHTCLEDSRDLAAHAQRIGARAVAAIGPCFFKPDSAGELAACCAAIAAAAPETPFYYYHIPSLSGVTLEMADFLAAAFGCVPTLAGIKFTHENLFDYGRCLRQEGGRFDMLFGRDEILLSALALGAQGAVGSTYNFAAPLYRRLMAAHAAGDLDAARREQAQAANIITVMVRHGGLPAAKEMMRMAGIDCGPVRLPLRALSPEQGAALRADLERVGFFANRR